SCYFFASRRRHTRSKRDWSSDVCSSDLVADDGAEHAVQCGLRVAGIKLSSSVEAAGPGRDVQSAGGVSHRNDGRVGSADEPQRRSEERRVGKEGGARWAKWEGQRD